jgi:hypothetical protein
MKRHVAATLLGVIGFLIMDSHIDWVRQDQGTLLEINGQKIDMQGWMAEHWRQWRQDCRGVQTEPTHTATAHAVLQTIQQHSLPDSLEAHLLQLHLQADWAIAEVEFKTLNPSIVVLRQRGSDWQIQDSAVWSGSTAPWHAGDFVRRYLQQQTPELPRTLIDCVPIEARRYAAMHQGQRS